MSSRYTMFSVFDELIEFSINMKLDYTLGFLFIFSPLSREMGKVIHMIYVTLLERSERTNQIAYVRKQYFSECFT